MPIKVNSGGAVGLPIYAFPIDSKHMSISHFLSPYYNKPRKAELVGFDYYSGQYQHVSSLKRAILWKFYYSLLWGLLAFNIHVLTLAL